MTDPHAVNRLSKGTIEAIAAEEAMGFEAEDMKLTPEADGSYRATFKMKEPDIKPSAKETFVMQMVYGRIKQMTQSRTLGLSKKQKADFSKIDLKTRWGMRNFLAFFAAMKPSMKKLVADKPDIAFLNRMHRRHVPRLGRDYKLLNGNNKRFVISLDNRQADLVEEKGGTTPQSHLLDVDSFLSRDKAARNRLLHGAPRGPQHYMRLKTLNDELNRMQDSPKPSPVKDINQAILMGRDAKPALAPVRRTPRFKPMFKPTALAF